MPSVFNAVDTYATLVITAPPGSGKTTRIPPALMGYTQGKIIVLQPRRAAARLVARRMAQEHQEPLGKRFGYRIRNESAVGADTRVEVVTEGILLRRLQSDPFLEGVGVVILDEFHERSLNADLALALLKEVQQEVRTDLKILILSATLDPSPLKQYFGETLIHLHSDGRTYPVTISYSPPKAQDALLEHLVTEVCSLCSQGLWGHVLVFLPGVKEIHRVEESLSERISQAVFPLHGRLTSRQQDEALAHTEHPKVVLSTNLAETSVTLPNVQWVVDSGLHRTSMVKDGFTRLKTEMISKDSAEQRSGRAGRTERGHALRLWGEFTHQRLEEQRQPEIERADLCHAFLQVLSWGADPESFDWFSPPPAASRQSTLDTLHQIGALKDRKITSVGRTLADLPIHPCWGRVLIAAQQNLLLDAAAALAAIATEDALGAIGVQSIEDGIQMVLDERCPKRVTRVVQQLTRPLLRRTPSTGPNTTQHSLAHCVLQGFPHRLGQVRPDQRRVLLSSGSEAWFHHNDGADTAFIVAIDLYTNSSGKTYISSFLPIQPQEFARTVRIVHRMSQDKVQAIREEYFGGIVLSRHNTSIDPAIAGEILQKSALKDPVRALQPNTQAVQLMRRLQFYGRTQGCPITKWSDLLPLICMGKSSLKELRQINLSQALEDALPWAIRQDLNRKVPRSMTVPSGATINIEYPDEGPPTLTARIQQLYGMEQTPQIGGQPILVILTAPNNRPQQKTQNMNEFWKNSYPEIRKELRGRYPKHAWPEAPQKEHAENRPKRKR